MFLRAKNKCPPKIVVFVSHVGVPGRMYRKPDVIGKPLGRLLQFGYIALQAIADECLCTEAQLRADDHADARVVSENLPSYILTFLCTLRNHPL